MKMKKLTINLLVLLALGSGAIAADKPNIILFLSDDHGWRDSGCYGNSEVRKQQGDTMPVSHERHDYRKAEAATANKKRSNSISKGKI